MNIAALLALLLNSGVCAKSDFQTAGGATLTVVVCPMIQGTDAASGAPSGTPPPPPAKPKPVEREAMG